MIHKQALLITVGVASLLTITNALNNGLGKTPAMGWNTWNKYGCEIDEAVIMNNTDQLISLGLAQLGYVYVNIDDCWQNVARDGNNHVVVDSTKFPNGMKYVGDYIHSQGLQFGIYSSAGTNTCQGRAASLTYEQIDAQDYASWGVDYLKYDNCYNLNLPGVDRYAAMRDALSATGRSIYYSICSWGDEDVAVWGNSTGNSWRTTGDISNNWESMKSNFLRNALHPESAGPGSWNDPDMLEIGNGGMTNAEERSHFALWAIVKSPLILGCDLTKISSTSLTIVKNKNLIKLNQDSWGYQGKCVQNCNGDIQVWGVKQGDDNGYFAALIINWNDVVAQSLVVDFVLIGATNSAKKSCGVTDVWSGTYIGAFQGVFIVPSINPHDNTVLKIKCTVAEDEDVETISEEGTFLSQ